MKIVIRFTDGIIVTFDNVHFFELEFDQFRIHYHYTFSSFPLCIIQSFNIYQF